MVRSSTMRHPLYGRRKSTAMVASLDSRSQTMACALTPSLARGTMGTFAKGTPKRGVLFWPQIIPSREGASFSPPIIADPNPANAGSIFQGSFSVWRTQDWGGDKDFLEANCPEFTTSASQPGC